MDIVEAPMATTGCTSSPRTGSSCQSVHWW